jgi:hypothetical protein
VWKKKMMDQPNHSIYTKISWNLVRVVVSSEQLLHKLVFHSRSQSRHFNYIRESSSWS